MGLSRAVSEIDGNFSRKSHIFHTPRVFCAPAGGVPLGIGYRRKGTKNYIDGFTRWSISFKIDLVFRLDALALSVIATATWLAGWLGGCHTPVLYQNG